MTVETRDVTAGSSLERHMVRQYLTAHGVAWEDVTDPTAPSRYDYTLRVTASPAEWEGINQWLQRTKVD